MCPFVVGLEASMFILAICLSESSTECVVELCIIISVDKLLFHIFFITNRVYVYSVLTLFYSGIFSVTLAMILKVFIIMIYYIYISLIISIHHIQYILSEYVLNLFIGLFIHLYVYLNIFLLLFFQMIF